MKTRFTILAIGATLMMLFFSACEKAEYLDGPETITNTNGSGIDSSDQVTAYSVSYDWGDSTRSLVFGGLVPVWNSTYSVAQVTLPAPLRTGDRIITMLQLGLQKPDAACTQNMHLEAGSIAGQFGGETPETTSLLFSGGMSQEAWDGDDLIRQFTRYGELTLTSDLPTAVIQAYARPWSGNCEGDLSHVVNCSFTVIVIPRE